MGNAVDTLACYQQPDMLTCYSQVEEDDSLVLYCPSCKKDDCSQAFKCIDCGDALAVRCNTTTFNQKIPDTKFEKRGAGYHTSFEDVGKDPMSVILSNGVQVPMKSLKDKDELFDAIYVTPNPDVREPLNNQPTIKLSIDAKSDDTNSLVPLGDPNPKMFNISPHIQEEWKELSLTRENIGGESSDEILNIRPHIQEESKEVSLTKEKIGGESSDNESNYSEFSEFSELEQELAEKSSKLEQVDSKVMAMAHELAMNIHNAQLLAKQKEINSTRQSLKEKVDSEQLLRATVASLTAESSEKSEKISSLQMELRQLGFVQEAQTSENDELATQITTPAGTVTSLSFETNQKGRRKISNPPLFNFLRTATH